MFKLSDSSDQGSYLEALSEEMNDVQAEERQLMRQLTEKQVLMGQLIRDQEQQTERIEQRNQSLTDLCNQLSLNCKYYVIKLVNKMKPKAKVKMSCLPANQADSCLH